jgi:hypothetical protein
MPPGFDISGSLIDLLVLHYPVPVFVPAQFIDAFYHC